MGIETFLMSFQTFQSIKLSLEVIGQFQVCITMMMDKWFSKRAETIQKISPNFQNFSLTDKNGRCIKMVASKRYTTCKSKQTLAEIKK